MELQESQRKIQVRDWLRANSGFYTAIANRTGVNRGWIYRFVSDDSIGNPGVNQIDALYEYMQRDLQLSKTSRAA